MWVRRVWLPPLSVLRRALVSGALKVDELVAYVLGRIRETASFGATVEVWEDELEGARDRWEESVRRGGDISLLGLLLGVKDTICVRGKRVQAASRILEGYRSPFDATVVGRLRRAGAIPFARHNCDEFAMGSANEYSVYGVARNPYDEGRTPGGSSGGSGVAVALGQCVCALGSDTGGSVRLPAAWCGVYGFKPTYGVFSRYGLIAFASSFDQIGILANYPEDILLMMRWMVGEDPMDATSVSYSVGEEKQVDEEYGRGLSIGYFVDWLEHPDLESEVRAMVQGVLDRLKDLGCRIRPLRFPYLEYLVPTYQVLTTAEASSNLARYDGVRYGYRVELGHGSVVLRSVEEMMVQTRSLGFGSEVKRRILLGTFVLSAGFYEAYYDRAQRARALLREAIRKVFQEVQFVLAPVAPCVPFRIGAFAEHPTAMYVIDQFPVLANLVGVPAMAMPVPGGAGGLPGGVQVLGDLLSDQSLLEFGMWYDGVVWGVSDGIERCGLGELEV